MATIFYRQNESRRRSCRGLLGPGMSGGSEISFNGLKTNGHQRTLARAKHEIEATRAMTGRAITVGLDVAPKTNAGN